MQRGSPRRFGTADNTSGLHLGELLLGCRQLGGIKPTSLGKDRASGGLDGVLNTVERRYAGQRVRNNIRELGQELMDVRIREQEGV
jgi:hypothetical protein